MQVVEGAYFARWVKSSGQTFLEIDGTRYLFVDDDSTQALRLRPEGEVIFWRKHRVLLMLLTLPLSLWFYNYLLGGFRFRVTLPHGHQVTLISGLGDWLRHTATLSRRMPARAPSYQLLRSAPLRTIND